MTASGFQIGFGEVDITPIKSILLGGYYYERRSTAVHDHLYARSMAISDGRNQVVMCVCDLINLGGCLDPTAGWIIPETRRLVHAKCGLPTESLILAAVHSHTSPDLAREKEYTATLPEMISESVRLAIADFAPRTLAVGRESAPGLQFIRRYRMKDGSVRTNPGIGNPEILEPLGAVDPDLHVLVASGKGQRVGGLAHFALHCDTVGETQISADWPHYLRKGVQEKLGDGFRLLTPIGPCGDVNHWNVFNDVSLRGFAEAERIGRSLSASALRALKHVSPVIPAGKVYSARKTLALKTRMPSPAELKAAKIRVAEPVAKVDFEVDRVEALRMIDANMVGPLAQTDITVLAFGNVALVGIPAEYFTELGCDIKNRSPFAYTLACTLANGNMGYVPAFHNYAEGGYEATSAILALGAGEQMADAAVELLHSAADTLGAN